MNETLIILATLLGPILAVQAQKWLERFRDAKAQRERVFKTLMATRGARLSQEHVQALNMIDLEFTGQKFEGVRNTWQSYRQQFDGPHESRSEAELAVWTSKTNEQFVALLRELSKALGYKYSDVELEKSAYMPMALSDMDNELTEIRKALTSFLSGKHPVKMSVVDFPDFEDSDAQKRIFDVISLLMAGESREKVLTELKKLKLLSEDEPVKLLPSNPTSI